MPATVPHPDKIQIKRRKKIEFGKQHITHHVSFPISYDQQQEMMEHIHLGKHKDKYEVIEE